MSIKRLAATAALFLVAVLTMTVGLAGAGTYTTGFESFALGTVNGQDGWHSAMPGDIPALPNGYDQAVVNTSDFGSPAGFGAKALRVSNAYSEPTGEFKFQTYSPSLTDGAGETQTNTVFDGQFQFISTSADEQPGLFVSVSPDNGVGARMSYVSLEDTATGIHITFYQTDPSGDFVPYDAGTYARNVVHTVRFLIQTVPGPANDVVRLNIDGTDIGNQLGACFTTWEQFYRVAEEHEPGVIDSFEFRTSGNGTTLTDLIGHGYLFDNVSTITRNTDPPAPTTCIRTQTSVTTMNVGQTKTVGDTATLTDVRNPTGDVSFQLYSDAACKNPVAGVSGSATLDNNGVATFAGASFTPTSTGTYYWGVSYPGDSHNYAASACGGPNEEIAVDKTSPQVSTLAVPSSAVVGSDELTTVSDTATFTDGYLLDGRDATFTLYSDAACTQATSVMGSATINDGEATFTGDASGLPVGAYYWGINLASDKNNNAVSECGGDEGVQNEVLQLGPRSPTTTTTLRNAATNATIVNGSTLPHGSSVYDTASFSNAGGFALTGTATFRFFKNGVCTGTATSIQTGVAVGAKSAATGPLDAGSYAFQAMYVAGDDSNHTNSDWSACEPFVIAPDIDLAVTKAGSPTPITVGTGDITWTMMVKNNGPDTATGVKVTDPLPAGTSFVSVSTSKGSCTGGAIISCSVATMAAGETVTVTLVTTPTVEGTATNTVTVVGNEHETNTANNTATASVVVKGFTPPPVYCVAISKVTPKQLFVGRKTKLTIHLTKHGKAVKGVHVRITGPKVNVRTNASNSKGVITRTVKMKKAGVLIFTPIASKRCNTKRVGVTNVFTPPVTG